MLRLGMATIGMLLGLWSVGSCSNGSIQKEQVAQLDSSAPVDSLPSLERMEGVETFARPDWSGFEPIVTPDLSPDLAAMDSHLQDHTPAEEPPKTEEVSSLDDILRLNHVQVKGTHNSYHIAPKVGLNAWKYTHDPLDVQLEKQGVRKLELDVYWDRNKLLYTVLHIPTLDPKTTCDKLTDCLKVVKSWSDKHPKHIPIFIMIEAKSNEPRSADNRYEKLERNILQVLPKEHILKPDDVRGAANSLQEAIQSKGWPTLRNARGKILFFLLAGSTERKQYAHNDKNLRNRLMFVVDEASKPYGVVTKIDDPVKNLQKIQDAVKKGFIIRTRADANLQASDSENEKRLQAALKSGAHMLSTDHPVPKGKRKYYAKIPGGNPARCNPITAPPQCTPQAIEDLK